VDEENCLNCVRRRHFDCSTESGRSRSTWSRLDAMEQVMAKVLQAGYTQVTKLEADDGRWEGGGIKNGQKMDFHADPKTGVITFEKLDD